MRDQTHGEFKQDDIFPGSSNHWGGQMLK